MYKPWSFKELGMQLYKKPELENLPHSIARPFFLGDLLYLILKLILESVWRINIRHVCIYRKRDMDNSESLLRNELIMSTLSTIFWALVCSSAYMRTLSWFSYTCFIPTEVFCSDIEILCVWYLLYICVHSVQTM